MAGNAEISNFYSQYLGRDGSKDAKGKAYWQNELSSGKMTLDQIGQSIASSNEAQKYKSSGLPSAPQAPAGHSSVAAQQQRYDRGQKLATDYQKSGFKPAASYEGRNTNESFVGAVYQNETGRDADQNGRDYWLNQMAGGMTRDQVIESFNRSKEGTGYDNPQQEQQAAPPSLQGAAQATLPQAKTASGLLDSILAKDSPLSLQTAGQMDSGKMTDQQVFSEFGRIRAKQEAQGNAGNNSNQGNTGNNSRMPDLQQTLARMPSAQQTTISKGMTSAGMLDQMLSKDSPLMRRASTQGLQQAQNRGLLNSSMAAGASQGAMIDRAQPFAITDSNNVIQNAQRNTDARNQRGLLQMGLMGDSYKSNQNFTQQLGLNQQQQGFTQSNLGLQDRIQQGQMKLGSELQASRDESLFSYDMEKTERTSEIQAARDQRLSELDAESAQLNASLQETRDKLLFAQSIESLGEEYGLRSDLAQQEARQTLEKLFASSNANAWGVMANNVTDLVGQASAQIQNIQMNPDIEQADKAALIQQVLSNRDTDIAFQGALYQNLASDLLNTGLFPDSTGTTSVSNAIVAAFRRAGQTPDSGTVEQWRTAIESGQATMADLEAQLLQQTTA